ncbi:hypothetical protein [Kitasatospora sp. NPDC093102]|uniref:hypothetical protein n=1 Tax=Kitasatospora sp. NPDC093102 TaxID=3155069 RepID=UPI00342164D5
MSNISTGGSPALAAEEGGAQAADETAADRLKARWAEPAAPVPPWWKRVRRATWIKAGAAAACVLLVAGVLATRPGQDDLKRYRLDPPQTIGELTREPDSDGRYARLDQELFPNLPTKVRYREHFVTAYSLPGSDEPDFLVVGATGSFASPVRELDRLLGGADPKYDPVPEHESPPAGYTVFPPGPLGGYLKCVGNEKGLLPACAWADQSGTTIGSVADYRSGASTDDLASLAERTRAVREAMTHQQK